MLGSKFARKIGYYDRRFRKAVRVEIEHVHRPHPDTTDRLIDELGEIESRSWLANTEDAHPRFMAGTGDELWKRLVDSTLGPNGQFDCWIMRADGQPVSFVFTLTAGQTRYFIANNYDEAVAAHRTGSTLYRLAIEDAIAGGVRTLDFGAEELHYKRHWGAAYTENLVTLVVGSSLPSRLIIRLANGVKSRRDQIAET